MTYTAVTLPLTGTGDANAVVATDNIGGAVYQAMKLVNGLEGSTLVFSGQSSDPASTDFGLIVRNIPGGVQTVVGAVTATGTTAVNVANQPTVDLSSAGSTKVVGTVNLTSGSILGASTAAIGVVSATGTTAVDLSSGGSTKVIGTVNQSSGAILGASTAAIGQITSGTQTIGSVQLTSAGTTGSIGSVALLAGSSANLVGAIIVGTAGSSANMVGTVVLSSGTTGITVGSVALLAGSSANVVGSIAQGNGSSAAIDWIVNSRPFSSGNAARTTVNSSVDVSVIAANANRKALIIASLSTAQVVSIGLTTATMTTALANASLYLQPMTQVSFGIQGGLPLYQGPIRAINISSTAVGGGLAVTEFTT